MRCDEARRAVSALVDDELDGAAPGDVDRITAHLASCDTCMAFEQDVVGLRTRLRFEPVGDVPDVVDAVLAAVQATRHPHTGSDGSATGAGTGPTSGGSAPRSEPTHDSSATGAGTGPTSGGRAAGTVTRALRPLVPPPRTGHAGRVGPAWPVAAVWAGRATVSTAAAIGFLAGATFIGIGGEPPMPAAADLPGRIATAQTAVSAVAADITVVEYGRPDRDGAREFEGRLRYGGPEELELTLHETTASRERARGSGTPGDGDVELSVTGGQWRLDSVRGCMPAPGRAACPDGANRVVRTVTGRAPFSDAAPIPLELVSPVESFTYASSPPSLGERTISGRRAIGVTVSAAQAARFVEQLSPAGDLRAVHPTDRAEMWLDRDDLVPLGLVVYAADSPERERWARSQGYDDAPGDRVLAFGATDVAIGDDAATVTVPAEPVGLADRRAADTSQRDEGFVTGDAPLVPVPATLPAGFAPARSGAVQTPGGPAVEVRAWAGGRAWVKVEATDEWTAEHLFGGLGAAVRAVDLGAGGRGYLSADGRKVAVHASDLDLLVTGSLPTDELVDLAAGLGVRGIALPEHWRESNATTLRRAARTVPDLLRPRGLEGFGRPAVHLARDAAVTQVYAGPGDRGFVLTQSTTPDLPPPTDDALGVEVRGRPGRYSTEQSLLEWTEGGASFSLAGPALSLSELLDIAGTLQRP